MLAPQRHNEHNAFPPVVLVVSSWFKKNALQRILIASSAQPLCTSAASVVNQPKVKTAKAAQHRAIEAYGGLHKFM
jgi:hypothetical protein